MTAAINFGAVACVGDVVCRLTPLVSFGFPCARVSPGDVSDATTSVSNSWFLNWYVISVLR